MARRKRPSRKQRKPEPVQALARDETRVIFAKDPAVLFAQVHAMTSHLVEPTHEISIVTDLPGTSGEWLAAILYPMISVPDGD